MIIAISIALVLTIGLSVYLLTQVIGLKKKNEKFETELGKMKILMESSLDLVESTVNDKVNKNKEHFDAAIKVLSKRITKTKESGV